MSAALHRITTSYRWARPVDKCVCSYTCTTAASPTKDKNKVKERPGEAQNTGGDEMTKSELTGKWKCRQQQTVPLPEHLGERGVAVI